MNYCTQHEAFVKPAPVWDRASRYDAAFRPPTEHPHEICRAFALSPLPQSRGGSRFVSSRRGDEQHHAATGPGNRRRICSVSFGAHPRRAAREVPGARRWAGAAGHRGLRSLGRASRGERRGPQADRTQVKNSRGERADLRDAHALGQQRAGAEAVPGRAGAR